MNSPLFLPITILILIVILFALVSFNTKKIDVTKRKKIIEHLLQLKSSVASEELSIRRDATIKLDNLLSKSFQLYFKNTLPCGDNLKNAKKIFKKRAYNSLWEVHKLRNKVVHNDYAISIDQGKHAYEIYKISIIKILQ